MNPIDDICRLTRVLGRLSRGVAVDPGEIDQLLTECKTRYGETIQYVYELTYAGDPEYASADPILYHSPAEAVEMAMQRASAFDMSPETIERNARTLKLNGRFVITNDANRKRRWKVREKRIW